MLTLRHDSLKLASSTPGIPVQMLWGEFLVRPLFPRGHRLRSGRRTARPVRAPPGEQPGRDAAPPRRARRGRPGGTHRRRAAAGHPIRRRAGADQPRERQLPRPGRRLARDLRRRRRARAVRHQHRREPGPERDDRPPPGAGGGAGRPLRHRGGGAHLLGGQRQRRPPLHRLQPRRRAARRLARACQPARRRGGQPGRRAAIPAQRPRRPHRAAGGGGAPRRRAVAGVDPRAGVVVVVDGVYSMTGELAPLDRIAELCDRHSARLVVDEAHGLGVLGPAGRGAAAHLGVLPRVDAVTIALSKALASVGGAVMTSRAAAEGIRASAMPYVFSAANDPASVAAALAALRVLRSEPERVTRLQDNCAVLRRVLTENGAAPLAGEGAVLAVPTGEDDVTGPAWRTAFERGVYTNAVTYPAVPRGRGVLRLTVMATHTEEQLRRAGEVVAGAIAEARSGRRERAVA